MAVEPDSPDAFRTVVQPARITPGIHYDDSILLLGSCFAESMGARLDERKFRVDINPFGVLYNPLSVARGLEILMGEGEFTREDLRERAGLWFSFAHHGSFSSPDPETCLARANERLRRGRDNLKHASRLMLTLGTARVHEKDGMVVANRHKLPEREFKERLLSVSEVVDALANAISRARKLNPDLRVLLTVSPIRHWKDGAAANQHSKAILVCAVRDLIEQFQGVDYFPAYEIMLDDLRDYRFYAEDMLHPSPAALDYIWRRFREACLAEECLDDMSQFEALVRARAHRPLHPDSPDHRAFLERHLALTRALVQKFPRLDFSPEIAHFSNPSTKM